MKLTHFLASLSVFLSLPVFLSRSYHSLRSVSLLLASAQCAERGTDREWDLSWLKCNEECSCQQTVTRLLLCPMWMELRHFGSLKILGKMWQWKLRCRGTFLHNNKRLCSRCRKRRHWWHDESMLIIVVTFFYFWSSYLVQNCCITTSN